MKTIKQPQGNEKIQPEYMSWDIERLRQEYFNIKLHSLAIDIQLSEAKAKNEAIDDFIGLLNKLTNWDKI